MVHRYTWACILLIGCVTGMVQSADAQSLDGTWEISTVIDDGRVIEPTDVLLNYAAPVSLQARQLTRTSNSSGCL